MKKINTTILVFTIFIIGCTGSGVNFMPENIPLIKIGKTTKQEVRTLFGKTDPGETVVLGDLTSEIESYYYRKAGGFHSRWDYKFISFEYVRDTVNGYMYNNSFEKYLTDFDETKLNDCIVNKTTRSEIISIFGNRHGEIVFPSNLLFKMVSEKTMRTVPENSKYVLVYSFYYLIESGDFMLTKSKLMVLSFDNNDVLINKYFTETKPSK